MKITKQYLKKLIKEQLSGEVPQHRAGGGTEAGFPPGSSPREAAEEVMEKLLDIIEEIDRLLDTGAPMNSFNFGDLGYELVEAAKTMEAILS